MSAAAPVPPPPPSSSSTGTANRIPQTSSNGTTSERVFAHIQDLLAQATTGHDPLSPLKTLIEIADHAAAEAQSLLTWRRPDLAFVEFTRAFELATKVIPRHPAYVDFVHDDKKGEQRLKVLNRRLFAAYDQFMSIKRIIEKDNQRNNVVPKASRTIYEQRKGREDPGRGDTPSRLRAGSSSLNGGNGNTTSHTYKPEISAGRPTSIARPSVTSRDTAEKQDVLLDRFSKLRLGNAAGEIKETEQHTASGSTYNQSLDMPSATDYNGFESVDTLKATIRPAGPRGMTSGASLPLRPAKLPLDSAAIAGLPRPPSPTYSPARNMETKGSIALPRHTARSLASNDVRRSSSGASHSSASIRAPNGFNDQDESYFPANNGVTFSPTAPRPTSGFESDVVTISASELYDHMPRFSVLLIDFRSREEFDQGHVFNRNIMCIEPMSIRQGMSAEELFDTLVLSPDSEQSLWESRGDFDVVVYYDQNSLSNISLTSPPTERQAKLKYLHEALYEFNQEKPLKSAPKLLLGGLDAWCDLVGMQSLAESNSLGQIKAQKGVALSQRRPLPTSSGRSDLQIPKRRHKDYKPLDSEEERRWHERARQESVSAPKAPVFQIGEEDDAVEVDFDSHDPANAAIEEFLQRFPDAGLIDHQAGLVTSQMPSRVPPPTPAKITRYPHPPPPSVHPQVPTRPAPAAPRMSYTGVSDRAATPVARASASLAPYIPAKYSSANFRLPRTGLLNFGVTCYMNATLQALSATTPLSAFFLEDSFRKEVQRENWKGSKGVLPELYSNVVRSLWQGDVEVIKPTTFRTFCGRLNREWSIDRQQDAKEFFDFLVDCLHEDLNSKWNQTPFKALTESEEQRREAMPKLVVSQIEWDRYCHREKSYLTSLFGGQHASRLRCTTCRFTSTTYEAFYSISVEIPRPTSNSGIVTLDECLQSYCAEEMLSGDEVWKCPHCRREREATKRITITRAPQFLVVHFKRFAAGHATSARKVRTPIDFPLQGLDLEPYMLPQPDHEQQGEIAKRYNTQYLKPGMSMSPPYVYDAYAVMRHIGTTLTSGHYTCAVKDRARSTWRMFNDTRVNDFQPEQLGRSAALNNEEAYIVFYQRRV